MDKKRVKTEAHQDDTESKPTNPRTNGQHSMYIFVELTDDEWKLIYEEDDTDTQSV